MTSRQTDGWIEGGMEGWTDGRVDRLLCLADGSGSEKGEDRGGD